MNLKKVVKAMFSPRKLPFKPRSKPSRDYSAEELVQYSVTREPVDLNCKAAVVMDTETDEVLFSKNGKEPLPQASITKVMTALLSTHSLRMNKILTISEKAHKTSCRKLNLPAGERFKVKDLLYAAMLPSSNKAAMALAEGVAGSKKKFVRLMNRQAVELGMFDTNYMNPHGIGTPKHLTTAYDQALLMSEAAKDSKLMDILEAKEWHFSSQDGKSDYSVESSNKLLGIIDGMKGGKTGTTPSAGGCFACVYDNGKRACSIVILGCSEGLKRWDDTRRLISYIDSL